MNYVKAEYTILDVDNERVELSYSVNGNVLAKLIFDYKKNDVEVIGDLYNLIGWKKTLEDKAKYEQYIELQKLAARVILNIQINRNNIDG